jgi:threonyl-tRNA synthetase
VHSDHDSYLQDVAAQLREQGVRVEVDLSDERFPKKIRNAQKSKVPFMLIAGDDDASAGAVSFRYRDGSQKNGVTVGEAVAEIVADIRERRLQPVGNASAPGEDLPGRQ